MTPRWRCASLTMQPAPLAVPKTARLIVLGTWAGSIVGRLKLWSVKRGNTMPTLHPHPEDLDFDDLEPMTLCDRCGDEVPVSDTSAGLPHWHEWPEATLCPDCWAEVEDEEKGR